MAFSDQPPSARLGVSIWLVRTRGNTSCGRCSCFRSGWSCLVPSRRRQWVACYDTLYHRHHPAGRSRVARGLPHREPGIRHSSTGGADAIEFERLAWEHASNGLKPLSDYLLDSAHFMVLPGALIYSVTGRAPYVLGLWMVLLGVGVIYLDLSGGLELWEDERMARIVAWSAALFPQLVLHSALFLREIPVSFCLAAAALCAVRFVKHNNIVYALWFSAWAALGALFHSGVIFAIPALLLGMMLVRSGGNRGKFKHYAVNACRRTRAGGCDLRGQRDRVRPREVRWFTRRGSRTVRATRASWYVGGAAYPEWMRVRGGLSDAWKIPIRFVALLFSPIVPFMVRSPGHLLGVVDAALYLFLFWSLYRNWGTIKQNRAGVILLVWCWCCSWCTRWASRTSGQPSDTARRCRRSCWCWRRGCRTSVAVAAASASSRWHGRANWFRRDGVDFGLDQ